MKKIITYIYVATCIVATSCSDSFLDTENKEYVSQEQIDKVAEQSPEALLAVSNAIVNGSYAFMRESPTWTASRHDDFGQKSIDLGLDLMSNDIVQTKYHWFIHYYNYTGRATTYSVNHIIWNFYYKIIRQVNTNINLLSNNADNLELRASLGRGLALRGFAYFNLVRVYQHTYVDSKGLPGVCIADTVGNEGNPRSSVEEVYTQILSDLNKAYTYLEGYERGPKYKIDQSVVAGILARVHLERQEWSKVVDYTDDVIKQHTLMDSTAWLKGFSNINNVEWIWGADMTAESSTVYASFFSHMYNTGPGYADNVFKLIDKKLYDSIASSDIRRQAFNSGDSALGKKMYLANKFVDKTFFEGDYVYMRTAEMYLMKAEALANMGNDADAAETLFQLISTRDPKYVKSTRTDTELLEEIYLHRRIELWGEGFAWFDMKRLKVNFDRDYPGSNHISFGKLGLDFENNEEDRNKLVFQIPEDEMKTNKALTEADQNPL